MNRHPLPHRLAWLAVALAGGLGLGTGCTGVELTCESACRLARACETGNCNNQGTPDPCAYCGTPDEDRFVACATATPDCHAIGDCLRDTADASATAPVGAPKRGCGWW